MTDKPWLIMNTVGYNSWLDDTPSLRHQTHQIINHMIWPGALPVWSISCSTVSQLDLIEWDMVEDVVGAVVIFSVSGLLNQPEYDKLTDIVWHHEVEHLFVIGVNRYCRSERILYRCAHDHKRCLIANGGIKTAVKIGTRRKSTG